MNKLITIFESLFNFILPKDDEVASIENMSEIDIRNSVEEANLVKDTKYKAVFQYKNKLVRKAIWAIKYNKNKKLLNTFSKILYEFILEDISDEAIFSNFDSPLLVPIPMFENDIKKRGYNQSELIAKEVSKIDENIYLHLSLDALLKIKATPHQSALKNKTERLKNLKNCFMANTKVVLGRNIILIDDVITTGTTMNEARKTLRESGAKNVIGYSIAH